MNNWELENSEIINSDLESIDPVTATALGCALPLEDHWDDLRWRALVEKHLLKSPAHVSAQNIPPIPANSDILSKIVF